MRQCLVLMVAFMGIIQCYSQSDFSAQDIEGEWLSTKPGAELLLTIAGSKGTIASVGNTKLTTAIVGGNMYDNIGYNGTGSWSAQRNAWIYNGVNGVNADKGHWEKAGTLKLTLSADKNTLNAAGHWTFKRADRSIASTTSSVYFYFTAWGYGVDYISSIVEINSSSPEKTGEAIALYKKKFTQQVSQALTDKIIEESDIRMVKILSAESKTSFEKTRYITINTRRGNKSRDVKTIDL